uniref:(northern house mosquito) hypothetical protein n=1 Tax=Culex pipiens TaxID=7175 RepID=A0A8D8NS03_CULPI
MQQQHHDDDVVINRKFTTNSPGVTQPMQSERPKRTQPPQLQNINQEHIVIVINSEEKQEVINEKRSIYGANIIEITFVCMQLDHVSEHEPTMASSRSTRDDPHPSIEGTIRVHRYPSNIHSDLGD